MDRARTAAAPPRSPRSAAASAPTTPRTSRSSTRTSSRSRLCLSGNYDPSAWNAWGEQGDATYFNNPMAYVANLDGDHLDWLREPGHLLLVVGQGAWEVDPTGSLPEHPRLRRGAAQQGHPARARRLGLRRPARLAVLARAARVTTCRDSARRPGHARPDSPRTSDRAAAGDRAGLADARSRRSCAGSARSPTADSAQHSFDVERVTIEPFDLRAKPRHELVIDRLAYWYYHPREWLKKVALMDDVYLLNSPFTFQSMEKHAAYCAMMRLGLNVPGHRARPVQEPARDTRSTPTPPSGTTGRSTSTRSPSSIGYPLFMKPYDGGAWVGVSQIRNPDELHRAYDESGQRLMHLQKAVAGYDVFARSLSIGAETMVMKFDPDQPMHARYSVVARLPRRRRPATRRSRSAGWSTRSSAGSSTPARR